MNEIVIETEEDLEVVTVTIKDVIGGVVGQKRGDVVTLETKRVIESHHLNGVNLHLKGI